MEGNKDESEKCIQFAEVYMREKKYQEAERFLKKAIKLYPNKNAEGD